MVENCLTVESGFDSGHPASLIVGLVHIWVFTLLSSVQTDILHVTAGTLSVKNNCGRTEVGIRVALVSISV